MVYPGLVVVCDVSLLVLFVLLLCILMLFLLRGVLVAVLPVVVLPPHHCLGDPDSSPRHPLVL